MKKFWYRLRYKPMFVLYKTNVVLRFCIGLRRPKVFKGLVYLPVSYYHEDNTLTYSQAAEYIRQAMLKKMRIL